MHDSDLTYDPLIGWVAVDKNDPATLAMAAEENHGGEDIDFEAIKSVPRDALLVLLRFIVPATSSSESKRWRMAQIRLAILAHMIDLDGIGSKSFQELGDELGCTRALLSLYSLRLADGLGINKLRNGKRRETRETYSRTATEAHRRQGHRIKQNEPQGDS